MPVAVGLPVLAHQAEPLRQPVVVRHDRATVAQGGEILRRVEAEAAEPADRARVPAAQLRADGLGAVLDHDHVARLAELDDRIHVGALAVEVDRDHRSRPYAERAAHGVEVHCPRFRLNVAEHRRRTGALDRRHRRHTGVRLSDDLVPRTESERPQRELYRVRSGRDPHRVGGGERRREFLLEGPSLAAEHEPAAVEHAPDRGVELTPQGGDATAQIVEWNCGDRRHPALSLRLAILPPMGRRRAMITGIGGQDGSYLAELLLEHGYEVFGVVRRAPSQRYENLESIRERIELLQADLLDERSLVRALESCRPHEVYNLASVSFVPMSWEQPVLTAEFAAVGVTTMLESIRAVDDGIRFYQASSSEIFGEPAEVPQTELTPLAPLTPYGVAKAYGHFITRSYRRRYGLHASSGILYNHESPRRPLDFVPRKVANAAAEIKLGLKGEVWLGNLDARRDWGYAGDYVRAMWLMLQQDEPDDYVIATGETHSVRELVESGLRARRARARRVRPDRQLARARQGRAARPRRRPVEGAGAARLGAHG